MPDQDPNNPNPQGTPPGDGGSSPVPAPAVPEPAKPAAPPAQPDIARIVSEAVAAAVAPLLAAREAAPIASGAPEPVDDIEAEIALRETQLAQCETGELDSKYRPRIQSALADAHARRQGRLIVEREGARNGFVNEYNNSVAAAHQAFPDLKDANTELSKETVAILQRSRTHTRVAEALNVRGKNAEKMDWNSLDPQTVYNAACQAHSIITRRNAGKPLSQQPGASAPPRAANAALEAGAGALPTGDEDIATLEAKAVASGDQRDWQNLITARDKREKQRKAMA